MTSCMRSGHLLVLGLLVTMVLGCQGMQGDVLVIVGDGEQSSVRGQVRFKRNPMTGSLGADLWKPGILNLFRADKRSWPRSF